MDTRSGEMETLINDLTGGDDQRAEAAVGKLSASGETLKEEVLGKLRMLTVSPDSEQRWWAVRALASLDRPEVVGDLISALNDADSAVRQCAAVGLRLHRDPGSAEALIHALNDRDHLVAESAAAALVEIGEPAVPALIDVVGSDALQARLMAVKALAKIGDTRAVPALMSALESDSAVMDFWIEAGLEQMGAGMVYFKA